MSVRFLIPVFFLYTGSCIAQIAKDDFAMINKTYDNNSRLSMKMKYEVYQNKDTKSVYQFETGEIEKNGNSKYTRIGEMETIENEKYTLIVDKEDKNISVLGKSIGTLPDKAEQLDMANMEQLLTICTKVEFKKENNNQNSYVLSIPNSEYTEVKLVYNSKTFFVEKMILFYNEEQNLEEKDGGLKEAPRVEITYYDFNIKPVFQEKDFTYEKYLVKSKGKFYGKEAYKSYTINENLLND